VVSHISQKTSEIWGTRNFVIGTQKSLLASFQILPTPSCSLGAQRSVVEGPAVRLSPKQMPYPNIDRAWSRARRKVSTMSVVG
jgi:hypothetical protein